MSAGKTSVAILGCGAMGTALLEGWLKSRHDLEFYLAVQTSASSAKLREAMNCIHEATASTAIRSITTGPAGFDRAVQDADLIILAFPPDLTILETVLSRDHIRAAIASKPTVSVLAGVSYSHFEELGLETGHLIRVLPTLAARITESISMIAENPKISTTHSELVAGLFGSLGSIERVPESLMAEATALGAVAHALAFVAVDTMADASAAEGLPRALALRLGSGFIRGGSSLLCTGMGPQEVKDSMAIARGITINSVLDLEKSARGEIARAVRSAIQYTREMV